MLPFLLALLSDEGDRQLFERIYLNHRKQMFVVARSYLQNNEDAEDVVHDVFLRVASTCWESVRRIENETDLRNYLLRSVRNCALSLLDRRAKKDLSLDDELIERRIVGNTADETFAAVCAGMEKTRILRSIEALPERYRDALYDRFVLRLSTAETAKAMGQSVSATKKQIQRGKQMLLKLLEE